MRACQRRASRRRNLPFWGLSGLKTRQVSRRQVRRRSKRTGVYMAQTRRQCAGPGFPERAGHRQIAGPGPRFEARAQASASSATPMARRSRHQQLPAAGRAPGERRLHRHRRLFARSSGSARACRRPASLSDEAMDRAVARAWRSAPRSCAAATFRWRARSRPRPAAAPPTAASSSSGCATRPGSRSRSSRRRKKRGWRCSAATSCSSPATGRPLIFDIGGGSTELVLIDQIDGMPRDPQLVERALGRRLADRKRGQRGDRGRGPARRLRPHARARPPLLRPLRRDAAERARRTSACSAPAAR